MVDDQSNVNETFIVQFMIVVVEDHPQNDSAGAIRSAAWEVVRNVAQVNLLGSSRQNSLGILRTVAVWSASCRKWLAMTSASIYPSASRHSVSQADQ